MDWFSARHTFPQNLFPDSKDKLANTALTKGNNTPTLLFALSSIAAIALPVIFALSFVA